MRGICQGILRLIVSNDPKLIILIFSSNQMQFQAQEKLFNNLWPEKSYHDINDIATLPTDVITFDVIIA